MKTLSLLFVGAAPYYIKNVGDTSARGEKLEPAVRKLLGLN